MTGQFSTASGAAVTGVVTFTPSQTLLDPTSQMVIPASGSSYPLSSAGTFTSDPLICTDNVDLEPQGWLYVVKVELQDLQPYTFTTPLPSSPSTVDISALEPVSVSIGSAPLTPVPSGAYLPSGGGTETGTLVLDANPPLKVPGATAGQILVSDGSGNFTLQSNTAGDATSIDGVAVTGTVAVGRTIVVTGTGPNVATWTLPLQVDQTSGDIQPLGASASWGSLTSQAAAPDHVHPTTGLVTTTGTQSISGTKTFTTSPTISGSVVNATDAATKAYVDASAAGLSIKLTVQAATTAALSPANTYANGSSGVGATLTATGNGTLTVDGHLVALNDRILVKDEAASANNGIYLCTTAGTVSVPYVLTRTTDMDTAAQVPGAFTFVVAGTANAGNSYTVTAGGPYTVGTTAIVWTLFSTPIAISAGTGLSVAGSTVSLITPVTIADGGTGTGTAAPQNDVFAGPATGGAGAPSFRALVAADVPTLNQSTTGSAGSFTGSLAGDVTGTQGATTVAKIQGTTVQTPAGGATSYLDATGHWTTPAGGGGASIDTNASHITNVTGSSTSAGIQTAAAASDHQHSAAGLVTTGGLNAVPLPLNQGGTGQNVASGGALLAALGGAATNKNFLRGNGTAIAMSPIIAGDMPTASTGAQGAVTIEGTVGNIKASPGTASIGGAATTNPAYADHVHGSPAVFGPTGLTGATTPTRYIGGVSGAAPTGGTYNTGDYAVDKNTGTLWICTAGSSPGPVAWSHLSGGSGFTNVMSAVGDTIVGGTGSPATPTALHLGAAGTSLTSILPHGGSTPAIGWGNPAPYVNVVTQFGAQNTGGGDQTAAIQAAINSLPSAKGGTIYFPAGNYAVNGTLDVSSVSAAGIVMCGDGEGGASTIVQNSLTADLISGLNMKSFVMHDLRLSGQAAAGTPATAGCGVNLYQASGVAGQDTTYVDIYDVRVLNMGGDGIKFDNALASRLCRCIVSGCLGNGFNINADVGTPATTPGTSVTVEACYAISNILAGYQMTATHYSSFVSTASDKNGIGYLLTSCNNITMSSPGCEFGTDNSGAHAGYTGMAYQINGGQNITLICPHSNQNLDRSYWITNGAKNVMLIQPSESNTTTTNSIVVDSGTYATVIRPFVNKPVSYAANAVSALPGVVTNANAGITGGTSGNPPYDPFDLFTVDTNGALHWGPGTAGTDTNLYRGAANLLQTDDGLSATLGLTLAGSAVTSPQPADLGYKAWAYDPVALTTSTSATLGGGGTAAAGSLMLIKIPLYGQSVSTASVDFYLTAVGVTLTSGQCFAYLYNSSGALVAATPDQSTAWTTGGNVGLLGANWTSGPFTVSGRFCWVALVYNGTTGPSFARSSNTIAGIANGRLSAAPGTPYRFGSILSGVTTATPGSITASSIAVKAATIWAALY